MMHKSRKVSLDNASVLLLARYRAQLPEQTERLDTELAADSLVFSSHGDASRRGSRAQSRVPFAAHAGAPVEWRAPARSGPLPAADQQGVQRCHVRYLYLISVWTSRGIAHGGRHWVALRLLPACLP